MRKTIGVVTGALFAYVVAPILVAMFTSGVSEGSLGGRILRLLYPAPVSERVTQPAEEAPPRMALATTAPALPQPSPAAKIAAEPRLALTPSSSQAPLIVRLGGAIGVAGRSIRLPLRLVAAREAFPVFATGGYNLDGWSATVQPGNLTCSSNINGLSGLTASKPEQWRDNQDRFTRLPAGVPVAMSVELMCERDIAAGSTANVTTTFGYIEDEQPQTVSFFATDLPLAR